MLFKGICTICSKVSFNVTDITAGIYFWKLSTISCAAAKRRFFVCSYFLLLVLIFPPPWTVMCKRPAAVLGGGNMSQKRRKCEPKEEEKWADKKLTFSRPLCLWWKFFKNKTQRQYVHCEMHLFRSNHIPFKTTWDYLQLLERDYLKLIRTI